MKIRFFDYILMLLSGLLMSGCTSVILVDPREPLNNDRVFNYDQVNARLAGKSATITCRAGRVYECYYSEVGRDTTVFVDQLSGAREYISTREVLKVRYTNHSAGAFTGGIVGTLGGIGLGVGIMLATSDASSDSRMGAVVGYFEGSTHEYRFKMVDPEAPTNNSVPRERAP